MTILEPQPALDAFDDVARGDTAPVWVRDGVLRDWDLPAGAEVRLIVLSENVTFAVSIDGEPVMVVRLGRPGYAASTAHIRGELQWVEALRADAGIPTPAPVRGADGDFVQFVTDPGGASWSAVAFGFVAGRLLENEPVEALAASFFEIGRLTALLHEHARAWTQPEGFVRFDWDLADMVGAAARWGDWRAAPLTAEQRDLLETAEERAVAVLGELGVDRSPEHWGLIHADLRPSNIMLQPDGQLSIIDFDDCGQGYYLYDFAAALTFYEHRPEAIDMAERWLAGYQQVRPLDADELRAAAALSLLRRLTMLGWQTTHREDALPADLWAANLPGTVTVAERFLADEEWIIRG